MGRSTDAFVLILQPALIMLDFATMRVANGNQNVYLDRNLAPNVIMKTHLACVEISGHTNGLAVSFGAAEKIEASYDRAIKSTTEISDR